jgi:hypothetical protein
MKRKFINVAVDILIVFLIFSGKSDGDESVYYQET